ncbi:MAG: family 10 glycosylhydrolase [Kiritimatiellaeota bacterium]|nr:family 10 glycosylhydrolase [Kiritimatiellota bacterium]
MSVRFPVGLLFFCVLAASAVRSEEAGCFISTGDNDWLWTSPPVNSEAAIEAMFDCLQEVYGVNRIYWRGAHSEWLLDNMITRPENFQAYAFWQWERRLIKHEGQSGTAIRSAHRRGMEIWGVLPLFDHGARARSDAAKVGTPSPVELRLRTEHPEYVPVDRRGLRLQSGPVEFAYPQVRQALVKQYLDLLERRAYDGLLFYTYVEHCSTRFEDEFGYNAPVAEEFKRRFGQDIRREMFDKHAWARLRGEYVTQFLRELGTALHRRGRKLGMAIDPQNTHLPAPWLCLRRDFHPAGRIYMDWEGWAREGLVDEIVVWCNGPLEKAINDVLAVTRGTRCSVAAFHSAAWPAHQRHFAEAGVRRIMAGSYAYIEWGTEGEQPVAALGSGDFLKRLRVLRQVAEGKTSVPFDRLLAMTADPNVLVRRQALRALEALGEPRAIPTFEQALNDPETGVRCVAVAALHNLHRAGTVSRIFRALRRQANFQFRNAAVSALANMPQERTPDILAGCTDRDPGIRRTAVSALSRGTRRPSAVPILIQVMADADAEVRYNAARALNRFPGRPEVGDCLLAHLDDPHPAVRSMVAIATRSCFQSHSRWIGARQKAALDALVRCFEGVGRSDRPDSDWTFRPVGAALLGLGPRGREALERFMDQRADRRLADFAWRTLYVRQTGWKYSLCSEKEALDGYARHPILAGWKTVPRPRTPEPERMPYIEQNFDDLAAYCRGEVGDSLDTEGLWRALGDAPPAPMVQAETAVGDKGNSLRLTRGPTGARHGVEGLRTDYRLTTENVRIGFRILRPDERSSLAVVWRDSGSARWYVGIFVAPGGKVSVAAGDRKWTRTAAVVPPGRWEQVRIEIDGTTAAYSVVLGEGERRRQVRSGISLPSGQRYNMLQAVPQGSEGSTTFLDNVLVTVPNPFH